jgi:lysophospholipase L1-like esterase
MNKKKSVVYCFGDSIMAQDGKIFARYPDYNPDQVGQRCVGWPSLLKKYLDVEVAANFAVSGDGIAAQKELILQQDFSQVDLVIISLGINDFTRGKAIGTMPDSEARTHDNTFIGDYCAALDYIFTSHPAIRVILMTPLHRNTLYRSQKGARNAIDTVIHGQVVLDFVRAIRDIGAFYSCPVADMYAESGLNRFNYPLYTFEGLHPTNPGYEFTVGPLLAAVKRTLRIY